MKKSTESLMTTVALIIFLVPLCAVTIPPLVRLTLALLHALFTLGKHSGLMTLVGGEIMFHALVLSIIVATPLLISLLAVKTMWKVHLPLHVYVLSLLLSPLTVGIARGMSTLGKVGNDLVVPTIIIIPTVILIFIIRTVWQVIANDKKS
jgi:hypothetical protein